MNWFQDRPQRLPGKLPAKALCLICSQGGESEEEKPAGAVAYKGTTYYFCNRGEIEKFLKDPEAFLPAPLPRTAPVFVLKTPTGETMTLDALKNKVLLVDFWATWCAPCVKAMPELQRLYTQYGPKGLTIVGISIDDEGAKKVAPFLAKSRTKFTYPILLDSGSTWKQWGVKSVPALFLVKEGQIVVQWSGAISPKELERVLQKML